MAYFCWTTLYIVLLFVVNTSSTGGVFNAEQNVYIMYTALGGADLILILLSIVMLFGIEVVICICCIFISNRLLLY